MSQPALDHRGQHVVGRVEVVADGVALVPAALHRVRRRALLGEVHEGVGPPVLEQVEQPLVVDGDVDVVERDVVAGHLLPRPQPLAHRADRRQRLALQLDVDLAAREVVDDRDLVPLCGEVERGGPAAEAVPTQDEYPHGLPFVMRPGRVERQVSADAASGAVGGGRRGRVDRADGRLRRWSGWTGAGARHPAGGGVEVDPALLGGVELPPPPSCPGVLPGGGGAGAGCTADAGVAAVVQLVVGHPVLVEVRPDLLGRPLQHRVELLEPVPLVPGRDLEVSPAGRLLAAQPGQPRAVAGEGAPQRLDLADPAALVTTLDGVVEAVLAVLGRPRGDLLGVGADHPDHRPVALVDAVGERVGVLGQPAGVDAEDVDVEPVPDDQVGHDHALGAERVGEDRGRVVCGDGPQEVERCGERIVVAHPCVLLDRLGDPSGAVMLTPGPVAGSAPAPRRGVGTGTGLAAPMH